MPYCLASSTLSAFPDQEGYLGEAITITGTITDPGLLDSQTMVIAWADGFTDTLQLDVTERQFTTTHTYAQTGEYAVMVTVTDKDGSWDEKNFAVTISTTGWQIYLPLTYR